LPRSPCPKTAEVVLPRVGSTSVVCVREPGHPGSHHDPAWEVYWSNNGRGVPEALSTTAGALSSQQITR
jgi:hypothetical protein